MINFVNYDQFIRDIIHWSSQLPQFDLIVGIPRSGMLPATILSLHRNCLLTDFTSFVKHNLIFEPGLRHRESKEIKEILIVDDTINSGYSFNKVKKEIGHDSRVKLGAVYAQKGSAGMIDFHYKIVPDPRVFQWNLMHHTILKESCSDIDGVLCRAPTPQENDDGPKYLHFLKTTEQLLESTIEFGALVSCRLEKYREATEEWMARHNIKYRQLILMDYPDREARQRAGNYAEYKAEAYIRTGAKLFLEDEEWQARRIAEISKKSVICTTNWKIFQ